MVAVIIPTKPTAKQCSDETEVVHNRRKGFACWYPQMGGYTSMCLIFPLFNHDVVVTPRNHNLEDTGCFDAWVWHDGEFPFDDNDNKGRIPIHLHHCDAEQFIRFGQLVKKRGAEIGKNNDVP